MNRDEALKVLRGGSDGIEKWNRLREQNEKVPELNNSDLRDAKLKEAKLTKLDMRDADLCCADLTGANLFRTNFTKAKLHLANLRWARLRYTDLTEADLTGADLTGADLTGATLRETRFNEAICHETMFGKVDLSSTIGLDTIRHKGRSSLDLVSLFDYHGEVPNAFLIGCGVPREFTANIQSLTFKISNFYSCFISYSHADKSFARRLHDRLQARGIRCWLDEKQVFPGDNIYAKVEEGIELWDKVLLCGSEASLTSGWVDDEIKHAFAKEKRLFSERSREVLALIPLNLDGYILDKWEHPKKNLVLERLVADFVGWKSDGTKFEQALERVVNALRTDEAAREKPPNPKL